MSHKVPIFRKPYLSYCPLKSFRCLFVLWPFVFVFDLVGPYVDPAGALFFFSISVFFSNSTSRSAAFFNKFCSIAGLRCGRCRLSIEPCCPWGGSRSIENEEGPQGSGGLRIEGPPSPAKGWMKGASPDPCIHGGGSCFCPIVKNQFEILFYFQIVDLFFMFFV